MKVKFGKQIDINEISDIVIDVFLFANNIERRKLSAYNQIKENNDIVKAYSFYYPNSKIENIEGVEELIINNHNEVVGFLKEKISSIKKDEINIFIDYSCMTKSWYYSIILYLSEVNIDFKKVRTFFSYTPSVYSEPLPPKPNTDIQPLPGKYRIPNNKPKALIVCLGYEQNKAQGIIDQLDPKLTYIFYTNPALDNRFVQTIKDNNSNILEQDKNIITYPFDNLLYLERKLTSLYYLLKDDYNIIIAPLGPKPFTFIAMMMSIVYPEIDIWRVGSGFDINKYEREPFDPPQFIVNEVIFEK
ncbi:hypothetical protein DI487_09865 [Flavobacterium sediminis]|uniref:SMODS-associated and fused to various effectors domain-containing protein n=1 Tax=Flavobacterium sediminis TaxID=2201181 RepID=A0A2U8QW46_9FLAO|nr:hypothetical protein [Flavobacterium sediminis]AWM14124.1 hypothetical protein DI487_09865 [Flavobacterium sediminis]